MARASLMVSSVCCALLVACGGGGGGGSGGGGGNGGGDGSGGGGDPGGQGADPLYAQQWHLNNTGQAGANGIPGLPGEDINVEPVWNSCGENEGCKGEAINIAVVDIGLEIGHADIQQNVPATLNHRLYSTTSGPRTGNPTPPEKDAESAHGTAVAGIIGARDNNGRGVRGVAPRSSLLGYNLMQANTVSNQVDAMTYQASAISVSNNSWGPPDGTGLLFDSSSLWREAIETGLAQGRGGRGTIYVWSAGNGGNRGDSSNYDGYANYRGVIAVGAVNARGQATVYTEPGANVWVSAPGGESCQTTLAITTADLSGAGGINSGSSGSDVRNADYTRCMSGTSASAPVVSGVAALMVQANPALGWRDVRTILARTARRNDALHPLWTQNAAQRSFNYLYGFGVVDAGAAVNAARGWTNLPQQKVFRSPTRTVNQPIPDNDPNGVSSSITVSNSGISNIEWVDVSFSSGDHSYAGDLRITLIAPSGTQTVLAAQHLCDPGPCNAYDGWRFGVARLLDEPADGEWRLVVQDREVTDTGTFQSWQLTVYGH